MTDIDFIKEYTQDGNEIAQDKLNYLTSNNRLKGYIGPRQCGKTYLLYQDLICNAFNNPGDYLVIAPNFPSLRLIQQYMEGCLDKFLLDLDSAMTSSSYTIRRISNGSTVTFISGSRITEYFLCGKNYEAVYIDEPRFVDRMLDMVDLLGPAITQKCGYISVFGTVNEEFAEDLRSIEFKLIYSSEVI